MKRLERLGSAAFFTVTLSLVYHLLAMSFNSMISTKCVNCNQTSPLNKWLTSLNQRCYEAPMAALFAAYNQTIPDSVAVSYTTQICVPNQYLMVKDPNYAYDCLLMNLQNAHTICSVGDYDQAQCRCDYSSATKAAIAFSVLTALILGVMVFLSHIISFVKIDYILKWLIPLCFSLLAVAVLFLVIILSIMGGKKNEDIEELIYSESLFKAAIKNETLIEAWKATIKASTNIHYTAQLGWCFGLEFLALHSALVSIILFALMFTAKQRPEGQQTTT